MNAINSAKLALANKQFEQAIDWLKQGLDNQDERPIALKMLASLYWQQRQFSQLEAICLQAKQDYSSDPFFVSYLAQAYRYRQQNTAAQACIHAFLATQQSNHYLINQLGLLMLEAGQTAEAALQFESAYQLNNQFVEPLFHRSKCQPSVEDALLKQMLQQTANCALTPEQRAFVDYGLFNVYDKRGETIKAFNYLQQGADSKRRTLNYNHLQETQLTADILAQFAQPSANNTLASETVNAVPIFICGLPRSGTTLLEQILDSHSDVTAGDEINELPLAAEWALKQSNIQQPFPFWASTCQPQLWQKIGQRYLTQTRYLQQTRFFTDKMLYNYRVIGLIQRALPQAKIIVCQRGAMDTLFGCYKQLFGEGLGFSYQFNELADTYKNYLALIEFWRQNNDNFYHCQYEDLVSEPALEIKKILKFIGLTWQPTCLEFHQNKRIALTISTSQIRQPISTQHVNSWHKYEKQLAPLVSLLQQSGVES